MDKGKSKPQLETVGFIGYTEIVPKTTASTTKLGGGSKSLQQNHSVGPQSYETTSKVRYEDKESGGYERYTAKEKVTYGERHVERGSRQVGVRDECKRSSTVKIGNKSGYTEYYTEERVRDVKFNNNISYNDYGGSNNLLKGDSNDSYSDGYYSDGYYSDDY